MKWRNVREQKRVPKRNINYLLQYYNLINFFTTTTTTTTALLSILCVVEQRLLLCEHCKRTFLTSSSPCASPLEPDLEVWNRETLSLPRGRKRKSVVHIATLLVFLNSSINFVWYYQSEKVHRSSSCQNFSLLVIRSSHHYTIHLKITQCPTSTTFYQVFCILNSFEETPQVIIFFSCQTWLNVYKKNPAC